MQVQQAFLLRIMLIGASIPEADVSTIKFELFFFHILSLA